MNFLIFFSFIVQLSSRSMYVFCSSIFLNFSLSNYLVFSVSFGTIFGVWAKIIIWFNNSWSLADFFLLDLKSISTNLKNKYIFYIFTCLFIPFPLAYNCLLKMIVYFILLQFLILVHIIISIFYTRNLFTLLSISFLLLFINLTFFILSLIFEIFFFSLPWTFKQHFVSHSYYQFILRDLLDLRHLVDLSNLLIISNFLKDFLKELFFLLFLRLIMVLFQNCHNFF